MTRFSFAGDWNVACPCPWKPLVDTWASDPFLPQDPREALISGKFGRVPLLTGICSEEGVLIVSDLIKEPKRWQLLVENWKQYVSMLTFHNHVEDMEEEDYLTVERIKEEYVGEGEVNNDSLGGLVDMFTDSYFKVGTLETCQILAGYGVPVFQYRLVVYFPRGLPSCI